MHASAAKNAGGHGFYRVRYSPDLSAALKESLRDKLSAVERFSLLNDSWATTIASLTPLPDYLNLINMLRAETDLNVWTSLIISGHQLHRIVDESQDRALQARMRQILAPAVGRIGWSPKEGETDLDRQLRGDLIGALGTLANDKECQESEKLPLRCEIMIRHDNTKRSKDESCGEDKKVS